MPGRRNAFVGRSSLPTLALPRVPWEGGPDYWTVAQSGARMAKAEAAGWSDPSFFPIGVWLSDPNHADELASIGINTYVGIFHEGGAGSVLTAAENAGMFVIAQSGEWTEAQVAGHDNVVGYIGAHEPELNVAWASYLPYINNLKTYEDGRFIYEALAHIVLQTHWYNGHAEEVILANDVTAIDQYCYTSPGIRGNFANDGNGNVATGWVGPYDDDDFVRCSGAYGWMMERMGVYDTGSVRPHWNNVETQMPFLEEDGPEIILYAEIRGAVWASLVNESRGLVYFQHNGNYAVSTNEPTVDPNTGGAINTETMSLVDGDAGLIAYVAAINAEIHALAPVLNTQSYVWDFGASGIRTMLKAKDGYVYIFTSVEAGGTTGSKTFTLPPGVTGTTVEVLNESRSISVVAGEFTDTFAQEYTQHNYRVAL